MDKMRLLPILFVAALGLFGLKLDNIVRGVAGLGVASALAKEPAAGEAAAETATADANGAAAKSETSSGGTGEARVMSDADSVAAEESRAVINPSELTAGELEVLQNLGKRREELEQRARDLDMREKVLLAAEKRIDEKIGQLKSLEGKIAGLLRQYDDEAEQQLRSLVKVYEAMKPKDAARIFEQLEMDILLDVTERMKEKKMAPVLAEMDPEKAKSLTVELATRRRLPETGG